MSYVGQSMKRFEDPKLVTAISCELSRKNENGVTLVG